MKILFNIEEDLKKRLQKKARESGLTISSFLRVLIIKELKKDKSYAQK